MIQNSAYSVKRDDLICQMSSWFWLNEMVAFHQISGAVDESIF